MGSQYMHGDFGLICIGDYLVSKRYEIQLIHTLGDGEAEGAEYMRYLIPSG